MPAYKDSKNGKWYARFKVKDFDGKQKDVWKRGFSTKKEALQFESEYKAQKVGSYLIKFSTFCDVYFNNIQHRIKLTTFYTKKSIVDKWIIPFFGNKYLSQISNKDVMEWQNFLLKQDKKGEQLTKSYIKTIHNQLSAIFNHAVKYYDLPKNPASIVGNISVPKSNDHIIWTLNEYNKFREAVMENPVYYYCFELLYWCGIREGELLALKVGDVDLENGILNVNETLTRINGKDIITLPKTNRSIRKITIPKFLVDELEEYLEMLYKPTKGDRLFNITKSNLIKVMHKYAKKAGIRDIRVHDLRHSHISLLIHLGYSVVDIASRVGHESIYITYNYAHMLPGKENEMSDKLNELGELDE